MRSPHSNVFFLLQEAKFAREDDVLPDGTFVPKGTAVMFCTYAINRLLPMWGKDASDYR